MSCDKNCINCAYLTRERHTWINGYRGYPLFKKVFESYWKKEKESLVSELRSSILKDDSSFLNKEKHEYEGFKQKVEDCKNKLEEERKQRKNELNNVNSVFGKLGLDNVFNDITFPKSITYSLLGNEKSLKDEAKELGFTDDEMPTDNFPDEDFLSCYMQQWKIGQVPDKSFLSEHTCNYFFSYNENEGIELEGIVKKQTRLQELENTITAKRSLESSNKNLKIAIIALIASFVASAGSIYVSYQDIKDSDSYQEESIQELRKQNEYLLGILSKVELLKQSKPNRKH